MSKFEKERDRLKDEFSQIQSEGSTFDISKHLALPGDLPNLGEIELFDYDSELLSVSENSMTVLEELVDLYLNDLPALKEHPYIKTKMREDAMVYSEAIFLTKMARKVLLSQMRQIDNGDNSARMYETTIQTFAQIRENAKFLSNQKTELEKFYKTLRKDMGYSEIDNPDVKRSELASDENQEDLVTDNRRLNEMIKNALAK